MNYSAGLVSGFGMAMVDLGVMEHVFTVKLSLSDLAFCLEFSRTR